MAALVQAPAPTASAAVIAGCCLIFVSVLGISRVPKFLTYLGKISYGLYVFHAGMMLLALWLMAPLKLASDSVASVLLVDLTALLLSIAAAHLSYQFFESPFMRLKERFAVVKSRPA